MKRISTLIFSGILGSGILLAQADPDVTFARVKELKEGQKIVLDVDNAIDKSFDLSKSDPNVKVSSGLKVGDPVKITEQNVNGKKMVDIARSAEGDAKHGDQTRDEVKRQ